MFPAWIPKILCADWDGRTTISRRVEIVLDWDRNPVMVIEYTDVVVKPFSEVTEDFAWDEGEGDRSLASWREGHWAFFTRACAALSRIPSESMPIVCTRFRKLFAKEDAVR